MVGGIIARVSAVNHIHSCDVVTAYLFSARPYAKTAREMGVTKQCVFRWRTGRSPVPAWAVRLCELLAERDAMRPTEFTAGLPGAPPRVQDAATATKAVSPTPRPTRSAKGRRKRIVRD